MTLQHCSNQRDCINDAHVVTQEYAQGLDDSVIRLLLAEDSLSLGKLVWAFKRCVCRSSSPECWAIGPSCWSVRSQGCWMTHPHQQLAVGTGVSTKASQELERRAPPKLNWRQHLCSAMLHPPPNTPAMKSGSIYDVKLWVTSCGFFFPS